MGMLPVFKCLREFSGYHRGEYVRGVVIYTRCGKKLNAYTLPSTFEFSHYDEVKYKKSE